MDAETITVEPLTKRNPMRVAMMKRHPRSKTMRDRRCRRMKDKRQVDREQE